MARRKTHEEFRKEFEELVGDEYTLLGKYGLSSIPVKVKHNTCGNIYEVRPNGFLRGNRCPECNGNRAKQKTTKQFKEEVYQLVGDEYTILGEYKTRSTNIEIRHNKCGREYEVEPGNFLYGSRCVECYYQSMRLVVEEVDEYISEYLGDNYKWKCRDYVSMQHDITIEHLTCGKEYQARLTDIVQKRIKCPNCSRSLGEQMVDETLEEWGVKFETQKTFEGLVNINPLHYDFYIPEYGILIEYQGEQHFRPKNFGGVPKEAAQENYEQQVIRDNIKREYARNNGKTLIEVPYTKRKKTQVEDFLKERMKPIVSNVKSLKPKT